jgi:hypothetical protein
MHGELEGCSAYFSAQGLNTKSTRCLHFCFPSRLSVALKMRCAEAHFWRGTSYFDRHHNHVLERMTF